MEDVERIVARLCRATDDLDGFLERRALELAEPAIKEAEARCAAEVALLRSDLVRRQDLIAELRRCLNVRERGPEGESSVEYGAPAMDGSGTVLCCTRPEHRSRVSPHTHSRTMSGWAPLEAATQ